MMNKTETLPLYDSASRKIPALDELRELLRYRNLLNQMVRRDIVTRYKRSFLGIAWTMLNPLGTTLILALVFSNVFGAERGYAAYVLSGLIPWTFFAQTTNACIVGLLWGGNLLSRIYLPRTVFAVSAIGTGLVNLGLSLIPLLVVILFSGISPQISMLLIPIPILFLAMFSLGIGLLLSAIAIHFADIAEMYQILLTALLYLSPVIYKEEFLPQEVLWIVRLNPMYHLLNFFKAFVLEGRFPSPMEYLVSGGIALVTLVIGWLYYTNRADEFAYRV